MVKTSLSKKTPGNKRIRFQRPRPILFVMRWMLRAAMVLFVLAILITSLFSIVNPPTSITMMSERGRLGTLDHDWVPMEQIAPVMARSAVAAEDSNFCQHWGLDVRAIEAALESGATRGGSTISQQVVKNVFLWQGRSWLRKTLEALWTPMAEIIWSKHRILELYLNVAEFDKGVFGVQAAAQNYFGVDAADLSAVQAARLASVLPSPKKFDAANPTSYIRKRSASIMDGAATIAADGRAGCFTDG